MARDALKDFIPKKPSQMKVHINHVNFCTLSLLPPPPVIYTYTYKQ